MDIIEKERDYEHSKRFHSSATVHILCIFICFTPSHFHSNLVHTFLSLFNITDLKIILYLIMVTFVAETSCFNPATFNMKFFS